MVDNLPGYYICRFGYGLGGPRGEELFAKHLVDKSQPNGHAKTVDLCFGIPIIGELHPFTVVRPIDRAYELLRYTDTRLRDSIYITRFNPRRLIWEDNPNAKSIEATPAMHRVFDELAPLFEKEVQRFWCDYREEAMRAYAKAGLTPDDAPQYPGDEASDRMKNNFKIAYAQFLKSKIFPNMTPSKPALVRVEGIEEVLDKIKVTTRSRKNQVACNIT